MANTEIKKAYLDILAKQFPGYNPLGAFFVDRADLGEKGWGNTECEFQIVWEDGPFDWSIQIFNNPKGWFAEAWNGFVLCVYDEREGADPKYGPINAPPPTPEGLPEVAARAQVAWDEAIRKEPDAGTCTGGKGLVLKGTMNYRTSTQNLIVRASCQGNLPASRTKEIPMKILADAGFETEYYDGWID